MKTYKLFAIIIACAASLAANAQIGYQLSLLNSATGEPRANETVSVTIDITNSENTSIYQGTQTATTNDFGVLSLQVGNATTFENVDWSKLPLFVSATVDGILVGRSQILNVPVAEAAKTLVNVSLDSICKTWMTDDGGSSLKLVLNRDGSFSLSYYSTSSDPAQWKTECSGNYVVDGHMIYVIHVSQTTTSVIKIIPTITYYKGKLFWQYAEKYRSFH